MKVLSTFSKPVWSLDRSCSGLEALCMYEKQLVLTKVLVTLFLPPSEGLIDGLLLAVVVSCSIRY